MNEKTYHLLISLFLLLAASVFSESKLKVGVVEFEEKNDIGVENAGRIVAEWMATELNKIGKFEVHERLLLKKVLEEQELLISDVIDESQAMEIGKIYGTEAIITGSLMKFGSKISLTGRIINVKNGQVIKTASVSTESLDRVESETAALANALCDISREQFEIRKDIAERSHHRIEIGGGTGAGISNNERGAVILEFTMRYTSPLLTLWIDGAPAGGIKGIEFGGTFNIKRFVGIGAVWGKFFDNVIDYVDVTYLHFGFIVRPRVNLEMGLFIGGVLTGTVWTMTEVSGLDSYWRFPTNYSVHFLYYPSDYLGLMIKYLGCEIGNLSEQMPYLFGDDYVGGKLHLGVLYRFVI
jgi:hypothetical protein